MSPKHLRGAMWIELLRQEEAKVIIPVHLYGMPPDG